MTPATAAAAELDWERAVAWLSRFRLQPTGSPRRLYIADGVIIDLEETPYTFTPAEARVNLTRLEHEPLAAPVVVRVNPPTSRDFAANVEALTLWSGPGWCVACASRRSTRRRTRPSPPRGTEPARARLQLESARAVADAREIGAVPGVHSLMLDSSSGRTSACRAAR